MRFNPLPNLGTALCVAVLWSLSGIALQATEPGAACPPVPRPQDQIWVIDVCDLGCGCDVLPSPGGLEVERFEAGSNWADSTLDDFLAAQTPDAETIVWVHGNRVEPWLARSRGLDVYRSLVAQDHQNRAIRMVIWSWPAAQIRGQLNDVRVKAYRTDPAGYQLAWVLAQIDPQTPLGLVGFSYGARVITGALHILGGGSLGSLALPTRANSEPRRARVVLMSAALDDHWLLPGHYHGRALSQVESMLLLNNSCDRVLQRYHLLYHGGRASALGYCGLACPYMLGDDLGKIDQRDVCCEVGRVHTSTATIDNPYLMSQAWDALTRASDTVESSGANTGL